MSSTEFLFALPILLVGSASALHATGYLHGDGLERQRWFWFYLAGTLASMTAVVFAHERFAFLVAWEAMGLFSAGLVGFESASRETKKAAWIYLLACQAGALALMLGFTRALPIALFIGFALKIGLPPFHVWLPEAHPAAPAPASAVMSGAMIPLGFCGLFRFGFCDCACAGETLLVFGVVAAVGGILFALPQHNLKKLLAFSSVENMGVVAMGAALGVFAPEGSDAAKLAWGGAALHIINHALLKGALFLGAGSVYRMTGTLDIDRLGGLMKKMPWTGSLFAVNALGLSGLPPLNGFLGEALIYLAGFKLLCAGVAVVPAATVVVALALTGGIAAAAYAKVVSATFLGEPRSDISDVVETPKRMLLAIGALTLLSFLVSGAIVFALPVAALWLVRRRLARGAVHPRQVTWDCGYAAPTARMAWTGTAFSQPLADTFRGVLCPREHEKRVPAEGLFPGDVAIAVETDDPGLARLFNPLFHHAARFLQRLHLLQNGSLHFYVLLMILAVAALLIWGAMI